MSIRYPHHSLVDKLGIKEGLAITFINAPDGYEKQIGYLPHTIQNKKKLHGMCDLIQFFTTSQAELEEKLGFLKEHLYPSGMLWISWPKSSSKVKTDLNKNIIREIGLSHGLVDIKVIAIDDTWSSLKFVL